MAAQQPKASHMTSSNFDQRGVTQENLRDHISGSIRGGGIGLGQTLQAPQAQCSDVQQQLDFAMHLMNALDEAAAILTGALGEGGVLTNQDTPVAAVPMTKGPEPRCRLSAHLHELARRIENRTLALHDLRRGLAV